MLVTLVCHEAFFRAQKLSTMKAKALIDLTRTQRKSGPFLAYILPMPFPYCRNLVRSFLSSFYYCCGCWLE